MGMNKGTLGAGLRQVMLGGCATFALLCSSVAASAEGSVPRMDVEVAVELQGDSVDSGTNTQNSIVPEVGVAASWVFTRHFSINAGLTLEHRYEGDDDFYFKSLGMLTDELYAQYEVGMFRFFGGKANPTFGTAWDITPGVYGTDMAEDYELGEGYGSAGVGVTLDGGALGKHVLTGTAFMRDRTFLSQTFFTSGARFTKADAGLANHSGLKSFSATLDSEDVFGLKGINSHLGYRKQATGDADAADMAKDDETGIVFGLSGGFDLTPAVKAELMAEFADFDNFGGDKGVDGQYITVGAGFAWQTYNLALAYTQKEIGSVESSQFAVSVGAELWNEWALDVGYKLDKADDATDDTHTVGFRLGKSFEFSTGR